MEENRDVSENEKYRYGFQTYKIIQRHFFSGVCRSLHACSFKGLSVSFSSQQKIFILANGKALEAYSADRKDNIPVEAKDHVKMFHHFFFTLDPDEKVIQSNINKALYMVDGSAKQQYDNLKENGYYSNVVSGNISQEIQMDSITIHTDAYSYFASGYPCIF